MRNFFGRFTGRTKKILLYIIISIILEYLELSESAILNEYFYIGVLH